MINGGMCLIQILEHIGKALDQFQLVIIARIQLFHLLVVTEFSELCIYGNSGKMKKKMNGRQERLFILQIFCS